MNEPVQDERELLVMRVLEGELSLESSELAEKTAADPELQPAIDDALELRQALDLAGETVRADMHAGVEDAQAQRARAVVRRLAAGTGGKLANADDGRAAARFPRWLLLVAASLIALFVLSRSFVGTEPDARPRMTLGSSLTDMSPDGEVDGFDRFRWRFDGIGEGRFEVQILRADSGELVTMERGLKQALWEPEPERTRGWPSKIRWIVSAYDASGAFLASEEARAERSSR